MWNKTYQDLYEKTKPIVKKDMCMQFYDAARPLYMDTDASEISLRVRLLQVREDMNCRHDKIWDNEILWPTTFSSKNLSSEEWCYSNIECEAHWILQGLEKFHHYSYVREVCIITSHKSLVAILCKDMAILSQ